MSETSIGTSTGTSTAASTPATPTTTGQKVAAELMGTFVLVFFGCGAAVVSGDYVATALAFGLAILVMVYAFGRVSGGHFNPAVTVGAALGGRIAWSQVPVYVGAQLAGAVLGGGVLWTVLHGFAGFDSEGSMGQNYFGDQNPTASYAAWAALILEIVMTLVFVWVILAVTDARNEHPGLAPLAIGLALAMIHFLGINFTGTSVNPARSIGPALFAGTDAIVQLWLFIVAPLVGGAIAGVTYPLLFGHGTEPVAGSGLSFGRPSPAAVPGYGAPNAFQQEWNQQAAYPVAQASTPAAQGGQGQVSQQPGQQSGQSAAQQSGQQAAPIIQDGWQWDPVAQQWFPADQAAARQATAQQWPDATDGRTQIRPDGQ